MEPPFEPPEWYNRYDCIIFIALTNRYGHPSPEVVERLLNAGVQIFDTRECGAVTVRTDGKGQIFVRTFLPLAG